MYRLLAVLALATGLSACTDATRDLADPVAPLGDFKLGHAAVVAPNVQQLLVSREATAEEWIAVTDAALEQRFRRFEGGKFYHLGVSVEAYSLPPPVVPGKSAVAMRVTVWDDAAEAKLNEETHVINVIQVFESRLGLSKEEQMTRLAETAAQQIEQWLREQQAEQGWFGGPDAGPETPEVSESAAPEAEEPAIAPDELAAE
ncbi:hypothetical protein [Pseudoponticoccus marisrubri]|uniref:Lipoprotein n=1 Tax=Pseudoponticoccus marisrubri TaxID=1685382 RepID=A0A0W7WHU0_9RHOB|nr:hypothetical protein [Pseudoponticoccus marisrubri]KUF10219.1 hypothetical protein AVJ23_13550 [Pseudoponticoccus marisrubri]